MNVPRTQASEPGPAAAQAKRFTYPGGSKPLDGFTIKRGVGHGGFGEVYYATSDAGKEVALKLIRRSLEVELRGIKQCLNLKHQNLLGVFDIKEDDRGDHWVIMEYVAGDCLDEVIARHPDGMPAHEALAWLSGIAAGVGYLHDHGIVHRDLKPGNIFSEEGHVKIGDYGLSKFVSCSRRSGHTESVGTVHYMAPEVANGRYGKEIDVYAMGIVLYEMLTGRLPFEGESVGEVLMKHLTAKPDVSMLEEPFRGVVARALEKDPAKRFSSVEEMLASLPIDRSSGVLPHARVTQAADGANGSNGAAHTWQAAACAAEVRPTADDEPILRELRKALQSVREWCRDSSPGVHVAKVALVALVVVMTASYWLPLAVPALFFYAVYRIIRAIVYPGGSPACPRSTGAAPVAPRDVTRGGVASNGASREEARGRRHYRQPRPYEPPTPALIVKSGRERVADLLGSMLLAAVVSIVMTLAIAAATPALGWQVAPEVFAYILLASIAGSWFVLVPSKFWEGTRGDSLLRRLVMMAMGVTLGVFAWGAMQWLAVDPQDLDRFPEDHYALFRHARGAGQWPLSICLVAFGTLMLIVRWWLQADPLRRLRVSLWPTAYSMIAATLVAMVWHAHGWALVAVAGIMSLSIQVASPWLDPRPRQPKLKA
ncbi:MAG TPA: hypothetical protein DD670_03450 [Planctomycetaceae bacterium]|nr:hypothetical protein [Planctomycetaceae bacterium]